MTIRNLDAFVNALWDWGILDGCFGSSRIHPTDIDGLIERKGRFLLLETKSPNKEIPKGQQVMFDHLIGLGCFTVIVLWGEPNRPDFIQIWGKDKKPTCLDDFRKLVSRWYRWADGNPLNRVTNRVASAPYGKQSVSVSLASGLAKNETPRLIER